MLLLITNIVLPLLFLLLLAPFEQVAPQVPPPPPPPMTYCEILANVISETKTPFLFKIEVPHGQQVEQLIFEGPGTSRVILKSNNCGTADWQLNTFQRDPNGQWQLAKASKARIDGAGGEMEIKVDNSLQPRMFSRFKVACSNHLFCG
ncbi:hypothetical protein niasHS_012542 [Heterodera schachtii]|uniref:Uncharacterized protein n=1 Tax=Heterodera schachtii TaxID=97005 RepID=A0ABD2I666_HETSC